MPKNYIDLEFKEGKVKTAQPGNFSTVINGNILEFPKNICTIDTFQWIYTVNQLFNVIKFNPQTKLLSNALGWTDEQVTQAGRKLKKQLTGIINPAEFDGF